ncbi:unnamed protein product [Orchesella dallaii]|uniref:DNA-directed RNA polymerase III subunit n=1 Tax=Orchesella dallaii TaxID=48710 RepID=A0ABP1PSM7_9HEXA
MATANPNETPSISRNFKQRQQSRPATLAPKRGGSPGSLNRSLNPVLPPLYPPANKPSMLNPEVATTVKVYSRLSQHFKSNFDIEFKRKCSNDFLERYTDKYKSPLALDPHLIHMSPDSKFPEELKLGTKQKQLPPPPPRGTAVPRQKRKLEDFPVGNDAVQSVSLMRIKQEPVSDDAVQVQSVPTVTATVPFFRIKQEPVSEEEEDEKENADIEDDEDEADFDEEMDVGTDYSMSYFDNGEDYDDDQDVDDGPTYY